MSFSIIHFSDIHIINSKDAIFQKADQLKAACASAIPSNGTVAIVVSGDIAYSGKTEQYVLAQGLLSSISQYIEREKSSKTIIVSVPGNHDCDFSNDNSIRKTLVDSIKPEVIDKDYYDNVVDVQNNYFAFCRSCGIEANGVLPTKEICLGQNNKVLFVLANTAWMSVLEEKVGKIVMPCEMYNPISSDLYKAVFFVGHHPDNWLNPDYKKTYIDYIRKYADMVLVGHEHVADNYIKYNQSFSVFCNHGKELQNTDNSEDSAFSVLTFDDAFQNYNIINYKWEQDKYIRESNSPNQYHKNIATLRNAYHPNQETLAKAEDIGITINHFAKENVVLSDLFVWPDIRRHNYRNEKASAKLIRENFEQELHKNSFSIITGGSYSGKTAMAKSLFLIEEPVQKCCLLINGNKFTSSENSNIQKIVEDAFCDQYSKDALEDFRQLPKEKKSIIIDDFDRIKNAAQRRENVLDFLTGYFGQVTIFLASYIEITSILTSKTITALDPLYYYDIFPLGNKKRNELITKWYRLNNGNLTPDEISKLVDNSQTLINTLLGNGASFVPATPVLILTVLQSSDAIKPGFDMSKYGVLYEMLIMGNLMKTSPDYMVSGTCDIDMETLSQLAFDMLIDKKRTTFTEEHIEDIVVKINSKSLLNISYQDILKRMQTAKIILEIPGEKGTYRFKYPYIFYYFSGRYIANHIKESQVEKSLEYMSSRLYNETYGNIIIFVCHFANSQDVISDVLLNAYDLLRDYKPFDFTKTNPVFAEIKDAVDALVPSLVASNNEVEVNKEKALTNLDNAGINDGIVIEEQEVIDDEVSEKEKDLAAISAALKTIEVLGQILQNYPTKVSGEDKIDAICEMHNLGMRAVQAIVKTMRYLEDDLVEYKFDQLSAKKEIVKKEEVAFAARNFINMLISSMARGMIHQVARSLNSNYLLWPVTEAYYHKDGSLSSKLVLLDLEMNCLNRVNYKEIEDLRKSFETNKEVFASRILDSIVGHYLNYNKCDFSLRARLCSLCGFTEKEVIVLSKTNLLQN